MKVTFAKRTVLVTGATRGIGKQIADDLRLLGANLILTGTNPTWIRKANQRLDREGSANCRYYHLDFTKKASIKKFFGDIRKYPRIDVCINNAGINIIERIDRARDKDWDDILNVNLKGPFLLTKALVPQMKKRKYGRIINIASIFGVVTRAKRSIYTTTKAGLIGMTKTVAVELARDNILVNAVSPGFIVTDMTRRILGAKGMAELKKQVPMGRLGVPRDISRTVLFLASDLNTYMTGQNVIIDGGFLDV